MALKLPEGQTAEVELEAGKYARWKDLSRHPNRRATKPWAQRVTDPHEDYKVTGDWLDSSTIDGDVCFDVSGLSPGDFVKVSGASHDNKKNAYYRVQALGGATLTVERVAESVVIEAVENGGPDPEPAPEAVEIDVGERPESFPGQLRDIRDELSQLAGSEQAVENRVSLTIEGAVNNLDQALEELDR